MGALAHGLPSLLIPLGADQPLNADRCADLGLGRVLDVTQVTGASVRAAATDLLDEPSYRHNTERLRDEIAALPDLGRVIGLLERLAVEKQPLRSV